MIKRYFIKLILIIIPGVCLVSNIYAQPRNQIFVGARPLGLGETFVAIADDGNASYWNPAGLASLNQIEVQTMYAKLYNIPGLQNFSFTVVAPLKYRYAFGINWFNYSFGDDELEYYLNKVNFSGSALVYKNFFLGANFNYLNSDAQLDNFSEGKVNGFGYDLGALCLFPLKKMGILKQINFGLMMHDVGGTNIKYSSTEKSEEIFKQNLRLGFSILLRKENLIKWFPLRNALLAFDFDDRFHTGVETWFLDNLGIRAGVQKDFNSDEGLSYSFGLTLKFKNFQTDYAYLTPPTLPSSQVFGASLSQNISPVNITNIRMPDIFASFYKSYTTSRSINVTVRNVSLRPLNITMRVLFPEIKKGNTDTTYILDPRELQEFSFSAIFPKDILAIKKSETHYLKIRIEYKLNNENQVFESIKKFNLYGRGAISWDDPGKAATFITTDDQKIKSLVQEISRNIPYRLKNNLRQVYLAAALFNTLKNMGIQYQEDPTYPYSKISKNQKTIDYIKYPAELLEEKQGDCDDLTVLYASLLECAGLRTAFISTNSHLTIMFDTELSEENRKFLYVSDSSLVIKDKTIWIPVEVTEIGNSFAQAWRTGGKNYINWQWDKSLKVINVQDAEEIYPGALPQDLENLPLPEKVSFDRLSLNEIDALRDYKIEAEKAYHLSELEIQPANNTLRNRFGVLLVQQDSIVSAMKQFDKIITTEPRNPPALINQGNVYFISGDLRAAEESYLKASRYAEEQPGLNLNLAILFQQLKSENAADSVRYQAESEKYLSRAVELLAGNQNRAFELLQIPVSDAVIGDSIDYQSAEKQLIAATKGFIKAGIKKYHAGKNVENAGITSNVLRKGEDINRRFILWWAN